MRAKARDSVATVKKRGERVSALSPFLIRLSRQAFAQILHQPLAETAPATDLQLDGAMTACSWRSLPIRAANLGRPRLLATFLRWRGP
jgi:hypothetical protein